MNSLRFLPLLCCMLFAGLWQSSLHAQCIAGDCENGSGTFVYESGTRYTGTFKDGKPFGLGTCDYANGNRYVGEWKTFPDGEGTMYYKDGTSKAGIWYKAKLIGGQDFVPEETIAKAPSPSPAPPAGECLSGDCENGEGIYSYPNGDSYAGPFKEGKPHGQGRLYSAEKDETQEGMWQEGEFITTIASKGGSTETPPDEQQIAALNTLNERLLAEEAAKVKVWAVIVGVSKYKEMPELNYTDDDAYQIYAFLKSPEGGALPDEQIRILIDESATKERITATMREIFGRADTTDVIVLYFSGHGKKGAFLPIDYNARGNRLEHNEVKAILRESPAKYKLCIADACHSGSLVRKRSFKAVELTIQSYYDAFQSVEGGTALFLSSKSEEISLEANGLRQGIFSHFLIRGLKGEADMNLDRVVTIAELYDFVHKNVKDFTEAFQTPLLKGNYDKNMPVGVIRN